MYYITYVRLNKCCWATGISNVEYLSDKWILIWIFATDY